MKSDQNFMTASMLLTQINAAKDGADINVPVVVNVGGEMKEHFESLLSAALRAKSPSSVVLYKWPEARLIDEKSLAEIFELLTDARITKIKLDVRNLSGSLLEDLYQKTKKVLSEMTARPLLIAYTMHNADYWAFRFMKLINLPLPVMLPVQDQPPRPDSVPPVSVTSNSIFSVEVTPNLSASAHAGSLNEGQAVYFDRPPPSLVDDDDLVPPPGMLIQKPEEQPASSWLPSCSVM